MGVISNRYEYDIDGNATACYYPLAGPTTATYQFIYKLYINDVKISSILKQALPTT
jgi:hypothetical protein